MRPPTNWPLLWRTADDFSYDPIFNPKNTMFNFTPSAPRPATAKPKAFTLIELLVVIAIIAILAAILFPVFARARENARRSSCQSNLKQIGLGIMQYTQDYDEFYPKGRLYNTAGNWAQVTLPYIKSTQVFQCPSHTRTGAIDGTNPSLPTVERGYAPNPRIIVPVAAASRSLGFVEQPAQKILVGEQQDQPWIDMVAPWNSVGNIDEGFVGHLGTGNFLFADGHVKSLRATATGTPFNMWGEMGGGQNDNPAKSPNEDAPNATLTQGLEQMQARFD